VVDHKIHRNQRIDALGLTTEAGNSVAHGGEIDHRRNAGEVLHQDTRRPERHLLGGAGLLQPFRNRAGVIDRIGLALFEA
jgi:hypothetical protein